MRLFVFVVLAIFVSAAAYSGTFYLLVQREAADSFISKLDAVKGPSDQTTHYTLPIEPLCATVSTVLLLIDDKAKAVLTPDEWGSRLATMPVEFLRPLPTP